MRIGIFDSGLGGVNVLSTLLKKYPNNEFIFFGDTKNLPYGDKKKEELLSLSSYAIEFLISKKVDIIIIACGTISSTCFNELRKKYSIPLYDIISPTINYLKNIDIKNIGVIGTKRTIESNIFDISDKNILMKATPNLVPIIESNRVLIEQDNIINELNCFKDYDLLVLGCTHYPCIKKLIEEKINIKTVDMGECLVNEINIPNDGKSSITLYFSDINKNLKENIKKIIKEKYTIKKNRPTSIILH